MIEYLYTLDKKLAAGLLARAALSLGYEGDPVAPLVKGEETIRSGLLDEARKKLGVDRDDNRLETIERIADFLDHVSDTFLGSPDTGAALARLAERGDLPSDLYEIKIIPNGIEIYGNQFSLEKEIIETTIRAPTLEQHFGPPRLPDQPAMISLFARTFRTKWPLKDFIMLVAGQRDGFCLHVHQAWRIYPSRVNVEGVKTPAPIGLVDLLTLMGQRFRSKVRRAIFFFSQQGTFQIQSIFRSSEVNRR